VNHSATYSPEDNKIRIYPACRLDKELYLRVKAAGFAWAPKQELFVAPAWSPAREDLALELCGEIGDEDTTLAERAEARADRFENYSESRANDAEQARAAVAAIADHIPLGQPILVGHHSERHARKDAEKIENGMRRAVKMWETSAYWEQRAAGAIRAAKYKERPDVRARRIKTIEAEIRQMQSRYTPSSKQIIMQQKGWSAPADAPKVPHIFCAPKGGRGGSWVPVEDLPKIEASYARAIAHCENRLVYERAMLADAGGTVADKTGPELGGGCKCWASPRGGWSYIQKVNKVTVTVLDNWGNGGKNFTRTIEFDKLTAVMTRAEVEQARAAGRLLECEDKTGFNLLDSPDPSRDEAPAVRNERLHLEHLAACEAEQARAADFKAMKESLRAGVKVVSAPQLFPTPAALAARMVEAAGVEPGDAVLEPSAGLGALLKALPTVRPGGHVVAVELHSVLAAGLESWADKTICGDFLEQTELGQFERIVMNPPFANYADIRHIKHAQTFLKPGGRLVALCANGPRQQEILKPIAENSGGWFEVLPAGSFTEQGTGVNVAMLVIERAPDPEPENFGVVADPAEVCADLGISFELQSPGAAPTSQLSLFE
jgi:hypothetical protein